jgi:hypothetical protein
MDARRPDHEHDVEVNEQYIKQLRDWLHGYPDRQEHYDEWCKLSTRIPYPSFIIPEMIAVVCHMVFTNERNYRPYFLRYPRGDIYTKFKICINCKDNATYLACCANASCVNEYDIELTSTYAYDKFNKAMTQYRQMMNNSIATFYATVMFEVIDHIKYAINKFASAFDYPADDIIHNFAYDCIKEAWVQYKNDPIIMMFTMISYTLKYIIRSPNKNFAFIKQSFKAVPNLLHELQQNQYIPAIQPIPEFSLYSFHSITLDNKTKYEMIGQLIRILLPFIDAPSNDMQLFQVHRNNMATKRIQVYHYTSDQITDKKKRNDTLNAIILEVEYKFCIPGSSHPVNNNQYHTPLTKFHTSVDNDALSNYASKYAGYQFIDDFDIIQASRTRRLASIENIYYDIHDHTWTEHTHTGNIRHRNPCDIYRCSNCSHIFNRVSDYSRRRQSANIVAFTLHWLGWYVYGSEAQTILKKIYEQLTTGFSRNVGQQYQWKPIAIAGDGVRRIPLLTELGDLSQRTYYNGDRNPELHGLFKKYYYDNFESGNIPVPGHVFEIIIAMEYLAYSINLYENARKHRYTRHVFDILINDFSHSSGLTELLLFLFEHIIKLTNMSTGSETQLAYTKTIEKVNSVQHLNLVHLAYTKLITSTGEPMDCCKPFIKFARALLLNDELHAYVSNHVSVMDVATRGKFKVMAFNTDIHVAAPDHYNNDKDGSDYMYSSSSTACTMKKNSVTILTELMRDINRITSLNEYAEIVRFTKVNKYTTVRDIHDVRYYTATSNPSLNLNYPADWSSAKTSMYDDINNTHSQHYVLTQLTSEQELSQMLNMPFPPHIQYIRNIKILKRIIDKLTKYVFGNLLQQLVGHASRIENDDVSRTITQLSSAIITALSNDDPTSEQIQLRQVSLGVQREMIKIYREYGYDIPLLFYEKLLLIVSEPYDTLDTLMIYHAHYMMMNYVHDHLFQQTQPAIIDDNIPIYQTVITRLMVHADVVYCLSLFDDNFNTLEFLGYVQFLERSTNSLFNVNGSFADIANTLYDEVSVVEATFKIQIPSSKNYALMFEILECLNNYVDSTDEVCIYTTIEHRTKIQLMRFYDICATHIDNMLNVTLSINNILTTICTALTNCIQQQHLYTHASMPTVLIILRICSNYLRPRNDGIDITINEIIENITQRAR